MEKFILKSLLTIGFLSMAACSSGEVEDISGLDDYTVVSGSFSQADSTAVHGIGTIRFATPLPGTGSSRSMALKASLNDTIALSSVTAVFYASDSNITASTGVTVKFIRQGASVTAEIGINGTTKAVNSSNMVYYFPTALDVIIDIHNVGTKSRVYLWRRDVTAYAPTSADVDSNVDMASSLPTATGPGLFAGLILQNATVTAAQVSTSKVLD